MISLNDKILLEKKINNIVKSIIFEESDKKSKDEDYSKRKSVIKWLSSEQELHSVLAYRLWPKKNKDTARSLFSKKFRGEDANGKKYGFSTLEINKLYSMKDKFISKID